MNRIISPPIKIKNKINENQAVLNKVLRSAQIRKAWVITLASIRIGGLNMQSTKELVIINRGKSVRIS